MKKLSISLTLAAALGASASAAEVTPFGFIGGYYSQGFSNMPTQTSATNSKEVGEAYAAVAAPRLIAKRWARHTPPWLHT